jgi:signal transduction histidine kinase
LSIDPQTLRSEQFLSIGLLIQQGAETLLQRWCQQAIAEQPTAPRVHHVTLQDQLRKLLTTLGQGLVVSNEQDLPQHHLVALEHGEQRWEAGWSLSEVVRDYQIMRLVILDYLDEQLDRPITMREVMAVGLAIDEASMASVDAYVKYGEQMRQEAVELSLHFERRTNEALRQSATELEHAQRRTNEFLATLAHELRNPLAPIQFAAETARMQGSPNQADAETWEVVERQVQFMTRLIDDLLDVTRISQGKMQLRREWTDLGKIFSQVQQSCAPLLQSRSQQLLMKLATSELQFEADPARVTQIVTNLLTNAAKYSPSKSRIWLEGSREADEIVIRVRDEGVGIAPELLPSVFKIYWQVDRSSDRTQGGLGIGLAVVRSLVDMHQGSITAHSEGLGRGSEFVVRLPVGKGRSHTPSSDPQVQATVARRILLVDDSDDTSGMLAILFRRQGHAVAIAADGRQALAALEEGLPEIAFIDIGLPDMDGYQLAEAIRALPGGDQIMLVAVTGYGQPEDRRRALDIGFDDHLLKPVKLEDLSRVLGRTR